MQREPGIFLLSIHTNILDPSADTCRRYLEEELLHGCGEEPDKGPCALHDAERPVYLLGESYGGILALAVAAACPGLVHRVVLVRELGDNLKETGREQRERMKLPYRIAGAL